MRELNASTNEAIVFHSYTRKRSYRKLNRQKQVQMENISLLIGGPVELPGRMHQNIMNLKVLGGTKAFHGFIKVQKPHSRACSASGCHFLHELLLDEAQSLALRDASIEDCFLWAQMAFLRNCGVGASTCICQRIRQKSQASWSMYLVPS